MSQPEDGTTEDVSANKKTIEKRIIPGQHGGWRPGLGRKKKPRPLLIPLSTPSAPAAIPLHGSYRCPVERWLYLNGEGMVVGQGIVFDGVSQECFLVLAKVNGGRKWVWASAAPRHETRKLIWKL